MTEHAKGYYISVDIEASCCIPGECDLLSIGACDVMNPKNTFYAELKPITGRTNPSAMRVIGDLWKECNVSGMNPEFVMKHFNSWLESFNAHVTMVGFNANFDWQFVNYYFIKYLGYNPFGINCIDIKAYLMGMMNCKWYETTKKRFKAKYPIFKTTAKHTHNALDDSVEQAELFRLMLEFNQKRSAIT